MASSHSSLLLQLLLLIIIVLQAPACSEGGRQEGIIKVWGTALCDSCQQNRLSLFSLPIYGATIKLACKRATNHSKSKSKSASALFVRKTVSDNHGAFAFDVPFSKPSNLRRCKVELTSSPFKGCSKHTRYSAKVLSPLLLKFHSKEEKVPTYSSGWLSVQPDLLPSFCNTNRSLPLKRADSKDASFVAQGFSLPWLPAGTPGFPSNLFPPSPSLPGSGSPNNNPFPFPFPIPFPPFPEFPPFPSFPFPFPFPFPSLPSPPFSVNLPPLDFSSFPEGWEFPPLPPNPFSPDAPQNPFTPSTPLPRFPPPNSLSPSTPLDPFNTPTVPKAPPVLQDPSLPPNPFSPSTPP